MDKQFTMSFVYIMVMVLSQTVTLTQGQGQPMDTEVMQQCLKLYIDEVRQLASKMTGGNLTIVCPAVERLAQCMFNSFGDIINQDNVKMVENIIETSLSEQGVKCDLDLSKIGGYGTGSGTGSGGSGTVDISIISQTPCVKDFLKKASDVTPKSKICSLAENAVECQLDSKADYHPSESEIQGMEDMLQTFFSQKNVQCQVDVRQAVKEHQHEHEKGSGNYGVSQFSATWSMRGIMVSVLSVFVLFGLM